VCAALDDGRAGTLVPAGDAPALARAVGALLDAPERARAFSARAQQRAMQEYDVTRMAARYAAIYKDLLS
jgi:glycosyltransferase involved in cell wall biosynthesis